MIPEEEFVTDREARPQAAGTSNRETAAPPTGKKKRANWKWSEAINSKPTLQ